MACPRTVCRRAVVFAIRGHIKIETEDGSVEHHKQEVTLVPAASMYPIAKTFFHRLNIFTPELHNEIAESEIVVAEARQDTRAIAP